MDRRYACRLRNGREGLCRTGSSPKCIPDARRARLSWATSGNRRDQRANCLASGSIKAATEALGKFDRNSIRVEDIGRATARPLQRLVVVLQADTKAVNTTDGFIHVVDYETDMIDVEI